MSGERVPHKGRSIGVLGMGGDPGHNPGTKNSNSSHPKALRSRRGAAVLAAAFCGLLAAPAISGCGGPSTSASASLACTTKVLSVTVKGNGVAAGTAYGRIVFRNKGSGRCRMVGFPYVELVTAQPQAINVAEDATNAPPRLPSVTLAPGKYASALLAWDDGTIDPSDICPQITGLTIIPPGTNGPVTLPFRIGAFGTFCERVYVGAVQAGAIPHA